MIPRIRTVKPEFFKHGLLYDLEERTGWPVRLAYEGLWIMCDREGRFEWKPRELKQDILPYDPVDFGAVLDLLAENGFIVKYDVAGRVYGWVIRFLNHQNINNRESASVIPAPPIEIVHRFEDAAFAAEFGVNGAPYPSSPDASTSTRDARVTDASPTREGREVHAGSVPFRSVPQEEAEGKKNLARRDAVPLPAIRGPRTMEAITTHLTSILAEVATGTRLRMSKEQQRQMQAEFIFAYWAAKTGHERTILDEKRERVLRRRLDENAGDVNELLYTIDGAIRDDWIMGREPNSKKKYDGIETIFRERSQVERFAATCRSYNAKEEHPLLAKYRAALESPNGGVP